jgi:DNA-binding CsgD family transcriptional regulator
MGSRIALLPQDTRDALEMAAIVGRDFGYAPLAAALRASPVSVVQALEPAVEAAILLHDRARQGGYRFSHVLIREAVVDAIGTARRAELHSVVLSGLRDTGWAVPSELAHHALQARMVIGDVAAAGFACAAAQAADRALAWEDAATWWQAVLDLTPHGIGAQATRMRLGQSLRKCGRMVEARTAFERVAVYALEVGDDAALAEAALATGETIAEVAADPGLITLLDSALSRNGFAADIRVKLLARRAIAAYWSPGDGGDARRRSADAVTSGRLVGDDRALAGALIARQFTLRGPDNLAERIAVGEQAKDIADRLDDDDLRFRSHQWLIPDRFQTGHLAGVRAELSAATTIAEASRDPLRRWWVTIFNGLLAGFSGQDSEVEEHAKEVGALGRRLGQPAADVYEVAQLVPLFWRLGRLTELEADLNRLVPEFPGLPTLRCDLLLMLAESGRRQAASSGLRELVANDFRALRRDSLFLASLAILGATAVAIGDVPHARVILAALAPYATRNLVQGAPVAWGSGAWHLNRLAALIGDDHAAGNYRIMADRLHGEWLTGPWGPVTDRPTRGLRADPLSDREREVLGLLAAGLTNREMAAKLGVSVHTVERHVANIFGKLGTHNRVEATGWALRHEIGHPAT